MNTQGIVIALIDVPQEHTEDYNRWYDFDHLPEFAALPGMLLGRRYVAPPEYKALRPPSPLPELADGRAKTISGHHQMFYCLKFPLPK